MSAAHRIASQLRRPFVRDVGVLQLGSFAALGVSFLLSVALARVLGPEGYGAYALVVSTMTAISLLKRLGQDYVATTRLAAAYATQDSSSARVALATFNRINLWSTVLVIPPALALAPAVAGGLFQDSDLGTPLRLALLPPIWAMLLGTVTLVLQSSRRVVTLTVVENSNTLGLALSGLAGAWLGGVSGVFLGQVGASLLLGLVGLVLYRRLQANDPLVPELGAHVVDVMRAPLPLRAELRSGLAMALDKNLVSLYPLAPMLLLGAVAASGEVALLRVAMSYLAVPLLALSAVSRLLMVKLPELHAVQPHRVRRIFLQVTALGGATSILLTLPVVLAAPWLIALLYGSEFSPAAALVPLLALDPLLAGFGIAAGPLFRTYGRNIWAVWSNLSVLLLGLPVAYLLVDIWGLEGAALSYAALATTLRAVAYILCLRILRPQTTPAQAA